jgi:uncharacterized coiled-coil DUF342 family protein
MTKAKGFKKKYKELEDRINELIDENKQFHHDLKMYRETTS